MLAKIKNKKRGIKYTFAEVKSIIEKDGNRLLATEYVNGKIPIEVACGACNTEYMVRFISYVRGARCMKCAIVKAGLGRRTDEDEIKKEMEKKGDKFIKTYYHRNRVHVTFECGKCQVEFSILYFNYKIRLSCICSKKKGKIDYQFVLNYIKEQGETLISTEYVNAQGKLKIKCKNCNDIYEMDWQSYQRSSRCGLCNVSRKKTCDEVKKLIEDGG